MIYLFRGYAFAACESEAAAQQREVEGYVRCTGAVHAALWARANEARLAELDAERALELPQPSEVGGAPTAPAQELTTAGKLPPLRTSMHGWGM